MNHDLPELRDILRVVRDFIDHVSDTVPAKDRYHALVCSYLLGIADRELAQDARINARTAPRLNQLLGSPPESEAVSVLSDRLQAGLYDERLDEILPLVLDLVIDKVKMTKPEHLDPMHQESL